MICKKCGNNIDEKSKFCGICGEKVEETPIIVPLNKPEETPSVEQSLEKTSIVEPITPQNNIEVRDVENVTPVVNNVNEQVEPIPNKDPNKKNNSWIFVILGVLLGVIVLVFVYFAYNKSSDNSVKVLERALNNLDFKAENSGTIDAKILIQSETEDSMNLSASLKYAKQGDDDYNFNFTLNKSMFFDEMNIYASILDDKATLYVNSSLIDMLGFTSSTPSMWVYATMTEQDLEMQTGTEIDELDDVELSDILDERHFKLIGEQNNLTHYQLVIDNELANKIKKEAAKEEELKDFADSLGELTETYYVDFYINNSNELVKISMDLTNSLDDESIKSAVISFEFNNFGNTSVQIPAEAKNSIIDLETYMATYINQEEPIIDSSFNQDYTFQY